MTFNDGPRPPAGLTRRALTGGTALAIATSVLPRAGGAQTAFAAPPRGARGPAVTLRFATSYVGVHPMSAPVRGILNAFTQDYPNVTIRIEETPGNDHQTKIKLDASSNRMPDLFNYWRLDPGFGLDQIARAGLVADLSGWTREDPAFEGLFDPSSWRTATLDGKVFGIPVIMFFIQFLANRDVFGRAGVPIPSDWASLNAAVQALRAAGEIPWAVSIGSDSQGGRIYNYVVNRSLGNDRALRMHSGREPIVVPEMVEAATRLRQLVVGNVPEDAITLRNDAVYAKYVNANRGALVIDGSFAGPQIAPAMRDKFVVLDFPLIPGGAQTETNVERDLTTLWYAGARPFADAAKRPYIMELMRRLSSRGAAKTYAEEAQQPVPMLGVDIDPERFGRLATEAQAVALRSPANRWIPSVMRPDQRSRFEPLLSEFLAGRHTPERFVAGLGSIFGA